MLEPEVLFDPADAEAVAEEAEAAEAAATRAEEAILPVATREGTVAVEAAEEVGL